MRSIAKHLDLRPIYIVAAVILTLEFGWSAVQYGYDKFHDSRLMIVDIKEVTIVGDGFIEVEYVTGDIMTMRYSVRVKETEFTRNPSICYGKAPSCMERHRYVTSEE